MPFRQLTRFRPKLLNDALSSVLALFIFGLIHSFTEVYFRIGLSDENYYTGHDSTDEVYICVWNTKHEEESLGNFLGKNVSFISLENTIKYLSFL